MNILDMPPEVIGILLKSIPYPVLKILRLVSTKFASLIAQQASFYENAKLQIPYESFQRAASFQSAIKLLKKIGPVKNLVIPFPSNKPGTCLVVLICNLWQALFKNVKIVNAVNQQNVMSHEPWVQFQTGDYWEQNNQLQIQIWMQFESSEIQYDLLPYKIWNDICQWDHRLYNVVANCANLVLNSPPKDELSCSNLKEELKFATIQVVCTNAPPSVANSEPIIQFRDDQHHERIPFAWTTGQSNLYKWRIKGYLRGALIIGICLFGWFLYHYFWDKK